MRSNYFLRSMKYESINLVERINFILSAIIIIITISPPLRIGMLYYGSIVICSYLWFLTAFMLKSDFFFNISKPVGIIALTFTSITVILFIFSNSIYWKLQVGLFLYYFIIVIFTFYRKYYQKYLFELMWIILTILPLWCIITIRALLVNPYVARSITEGSTANELNRQGIGGYGLVYMSAIIGFICFITFFNAKNISSLQKLIMFVNAILCITLSVLSGFTMSLMSIIICMFVYLLFKKNKYGKIKVKFMLLSTVGITMVILNTYKILNYLLKISLNTSHYSKIYDFYIFLETGSLGNTFVARIDAYSISLQTYSKNWVLGLMSSPNLNLTWDIYGGHSAILDGFSLFGTAIGILNLYIMLLIPFGIFREKRYNKTSLPIGVLSGVFFILLLNNISDMYAVSVTIILYCCVELICEENVNIEQKN